MIVKPWLKRIKVDCFAVLIGRERITKAISVLNSVMADLDTSYIKYLGSDMSACVLLNLLNELGESNKMSGIYSFFATSLIFQ